MTYLSDIISTMVDCDPEWYIPVSSSFSGALHLNSRPFQTSPMCNKHHTTGDLLLCVKQRFDMFANDILSWVSIGGARDHSSRLRMVTSSNGNIFCICGPLCGNTPVTGEFPAQRPVTQSFDVFFDLHLNNGWVNNREAGDLRRHRAHYDVIQMCICSMIVIFKYYTRTKNLRM